MNQTSMAHRTLFNSTVLPAPTPSSSRNSIAISSTITIPGIAKATYLHFSIFFAGRIPLCLAIKPIMNTNRMNVTANATIWIRVEFTVSPEFAFF